MSIKKLQNNFTTPEQSKRLLELGIPADSADCYYTQEEIECNKYWFDLHIKREYQPHADLHASTIWYEILPCWSVGRLLEIYDTFGVLTTPQYCENYVEELVCEFENLVKNNGFDFSKLEE